MRFTPSSRRPSRSSSAFRFGFVAAAVVLGACGVVTADESAFPESDGARKGSAGGDDALQNVDGGSRPTTPAPDAGYTHTGSPLCGDKADCSPDDPRAVLCGNVAAPPGDGGAASSSSSSGGGDESPEEDADVTEDAGPAALPLACRVTSEGVNSCSHPAGNGGEGAACKAGTDCGAGLDCVREPGKRAGACRAYCCEGLCSGVLGNEGDGRFCDPAVRSDDERRIPACLPIHACRLLGNDECGERETCAVVRELDGSTGCVEVGTAQVGESCDAQHCAAGLNCLGSVGTRTCFQLCSSSGTACPPGQSCTWAPPTFREAGLGVCTESAAQRAF